MKLSELEPMLDPRKPLRLAGAPEPIRPGLRPAPQRTRLAQLGSADLIIDADQDLAGVDAAIALLSAQSDLVSRDHHHWQQTSVRLHRRPKLSGLRDRAVRTVELFTGAGSGIITALWRQEQDQLNAQLRAELARRWQHLRSTRAAVTASEPTPLAAMSTELAEIKLLWAQCEQFEAASAAFSANTVVALSVGAATAISARRSVPRAPLERAFQRRGDWGAGLVWLPDRRVFVGWSSTPESPAGTGPADTELFEIDAAELATWVRSLQTDTPRLLHWRRSVIPANAKLSSDESWVGIATVLTQLFQLGQSTAPTVEPERPRHLRVRAIPMNRDRIDAPPTRFMISAAEGRTGTPPFELASGESATVDWNPGRWRPVWSAEQNRYVRTWTDAYAKDDRRPSNEPILVTVMI